MNGKIKQICVVRSVGENDKFFVTFDLVRSDETEVKLTRHVIGAELIDYLQQTLETLKDIV